MLLRRYQPFILISVFTFMIPVDVPMSGNFCNESEKSIKESVQDMEPRGFVEEVILTSFNFIVTPCLQNG